MKWKVNVFGFGNFIHSTDIKKTINSHAIMSFHWLHGTNHLKYIILEVQFDPGIQ